MTPLTFLEYLIALAGGVVVIGLAVIAVVLAWAYVIGKTTK